MSEEETKITPKMMMEEIQSLKKEIQTLKIGSSEPKKEPKTESQAHKSLSEALDCPNCGTQTWQDVKNALPKVMQRLEDERKNMQYVCKGCGLGVEPREEEICPRCRGKEARSRA